MRAAYIAGAAVALLILVIKPAAIVAIQAAATLGAALQ